MSDAALKVDPEFYNRRLLDTETTSDRSRIAYRVGEVRGAGTTGGGGRGGMAGGYIAPELADYLVRQHSLLGFYLSLNPRDEGVFDTSVGLPNLWFSSIGSIVERCGSFITHTVGDCMVHYLLYCIPFSYLSLYPVGG